MASHVNPSSAGNDPSEWTDEEIRDFLKIRDIRIPLTSSTKPQIVRKIQKLLNHAAVGIDPLEKANGGDVVEEIVVEPQSTAQSEAEPTCYYGVALGKGAETDADEPASPYYTNKKDVLTLSAKRKGSRFKKFSTKEEATRFSQTDLSSPLPSSSNPPPSAGEEKANSYSQPNQPLLNKFKAMIESGNVEKFAECVWENPRYLVTSGDGPTILFPGFFFNALHVAVTKNQLQVCQELFAIISSDKFWELVYPMDSHETREMRKHHLVDMYLNRQTGRPLAAKQNRDSPLHIASKNGLEDVVKFLMTFSQIDPTVMDREGKTPKEVACQRAGSRDVKERIERLIDEPETCFVPLYRSEDNSTSPHIGSPCMWSEFCPRVQSASPFEPDYTNTALAGPMSPSQAKLFYRLWKTPQSSSSKDRMRRDPERGLERVGRELAVSKEIGWAERWDFLDAFCDVSSPEGLALLEAHLQQQSTEGGTPSPLSSVRRTGEGDLSGSPLLPSANIQASPGRQAMHSGDIDSKECVKQSLDFEEEPCTGNEEEETKEQQLSLDGSSVNELIPLLGDLNLDKCEVVVDSVTGGPSVEEAGSGSGTVSGGPSVEEAGSGSDTVTGGPSVEEAGSGSGTVTGGLSMEEAGSGSSTKTHSHMDIANSSGDGATGVSGTPVLISCAGEESLQPSTDLMQTDLATPHSTPQGENSVFLLGSSIPSKLDQDVLEAIGEAEVDAEQFPCVRSWQKSAGSYPLKERESWRTPRSASCHRPPPPGGRRHSTQRMPLSPLIYSSSPGTPGSPRATRSTRPSTPSLVGVTTTPRRLPMTYNRAGPATSHIT